MICRKIIKGVRFDLTLSVFSKNLRKKGLNISTPFWGLVLPTYSKVTLKSQRKQKTI